MILRLAFASDNSKPDLIVTCNRTIPNYNGGALIKTNIINKCHRGCMLYLHLFHICAQHMSRKPFVKSRKEYILHCVRCECDLCVVKEAQLISINCSMKCSTYYESQNKLHSLVMRVNIYFNTHSRLLLSD